MSAHVDLHSRTGIDCYIRNMLYVHSYRTGAVTTQH